MTHPEIGHILDVPFQVEVELDRRILSVAEILQLKHGSVIKMTRSAGENIDVVIGGSLIGFGEIVIIEDLMGVRITDFNGEE
jgi:flagellar motor switch protein FliN/FliY